MTEFTITIRHLEIDSLVVYLHPTSRKEFEFYFSENFSYESSGGGTNKKKIITGAATRACTSQLIPQNENIVRNNGGEQSPSSAVQYKAIT